MKYGVGQKVTFHEGGKLERSDATPIIFYLIHYFREQFICCNDSGIILGFLSMLKII